MNPAGALHIRVVWDGEAVPGVDIGSTRPRATQLLLGKPAAEVAGLLPLIYAICGRAQQCAGQAALDAARGQAVRVSPETAFGVLTEATQEHLWRLLLDWPQLLGLEALEQDFSNWYRRLAASAKSATVAQMTGQLAGLAGFVESAVLGMPLAAWLALDDAAAIQPGATLAGDLWQALADAPALPGGAVAWLPAGGAAEFAGIAAADWDGDFARQPTWQGLPAETGALARWRTQPLVAAELAAQGRGVRARLLARLMDLAQCVAAIAAPEAWLADSRCDACSPAPGVGLARLETARGTLLHRVCLDTAAGPERIGAYAVVAPTEWNFHPRGAFVAALQNVGAASAEALRQKAQRLALAFDPCVAYRLEVSHA